MYISNNIKIRFESYWKAFANNFAALMKIVCFEINPCVLLHLSGENVTQCGFKELQVRGVFCLASHLSLKHYFKEIYLSWNRTEAESGTSHTHLGPKLLKTLLQVF